MTNKIWVYLDQFKGKVSPASWEAIGAATQLSKEFGGGITALVFGKGVEEIAQEAITFGATEVLLAEDDTLNDFRPEPYSSLLAKLAAEQQPEVILLPDTTRGRDLAAMVSIDLKTGVIPDVIALEVSAGEITATRAVYSGKLISKVKCTARPYIITLRLRTFSKPESDDGRKGVITRVSIAVAEENIPSKVKEYIRGEGSVSLTEANVIVAGGRGMVNRPTLTPPAEIKGDKEVDKWRTQQGFKLISELAETLGGAAGASRAVVDPGYVAYEHQIGQTGKVVSPNLYIACGISGAIQHLAGMRSSKVIVAINRDANAPIFQSARFGVVGDLFDILPPLNAAMRKRLGK